MTSEALPGKETQRTSVVQSRTSQSSQSPLSTQSETRTKTRTNCKSSTTTTGTLHVPNSLSSGTDPQSERTSSQRHPIRVPETIAVPNKSRLLTKSQTRLSVSIAEFQNHLFHQSEQRLLCFRPLNTSPKTVKLKKGLKRQNRWPETLKLELVLF